MTEGQTRPDRILYTCPSCQRQLRIPIEFAGMKVSCRFCNAELIAPAHPSLPPADGLRFVGTGVAFEIVRTWAGDGEEEHRTTILRDPLKHDLAMFTLALECFGPSTVHVGGLSVESGELIPLGRARAGECRIIPLRGVYHVYAWVERGEQSRARMIVARQE